MTGTAVDAAAAVDAAEAAADAADRAATSARMSRQASHDTGPERALRSALHRRGLRYFVHRRPLPALRREADIVFIRTQVAVFVDGCFWHGCPTHGTRPRRNAQYWSEKISRNRRRDADTDTRLAADGWTPVRVWEHEPPEEAADRIETLIHERIARLAAERERAAAG